jgi:hypothetical protein
MRGRTVLFGAAIAALIVISTVVLYWVLGSFYPSQFFAALLASALVSMGSGLISILFAYCRAVKVLQTDLDPAVASRRLRLHLKGIGYLIDPQDDRTTLLLDD